MKKYLFKHCYNIEFIPDTNYYIRETFQELTEILKGVEYIRISCARLLNKDIAILSYDIKSRYKEDYLKELLQDICPAARILRIRKI